MNGRDVLSDLYKPKAIVERYKSYLLELANVQCKIRDMRDDFRDVSNKLNDAGDTWMDADEILINLGSLLADLTVYTSEYEAEASNEK